jgi:amidase
MAELHDLTALEQGELIRKGELSPLELTEHYLDRVARLDDVGGFVTTTAAQARERAAALPSGEGPLWGVPTAIKDLNLTAGVPTMFGSEAFRDFVPKVSDGVTLSIETAGMVSLGKTNTPEFGSPCYTEPDVAPPAVTPWDRSRMAGGSSGGAAAAVAAGLVPVAHGSDGGGSIRIPASVNGLVGLKPTRDRLAQDRMMREMPVRIVSDGVLTRSVRDTAAFYREAEKVYRNLEIPPVGDITRPGKARLDVALVTDGIGRSASPEVAELTTKTGALLEELGHRVHPVPQPVPGHVKDDFLVYWSLLAMFTVRAGRRTFGRTWDPGQLDNLTHGLARHSARRLHRLPLAVARLKRMRRWSREFFTRYDVVLTPTLAAETPQIGHLAPTQDFDVIMERLLEWVAFTPLQNATGDPAISLPLATTTAGLPQGMMLGAGWGREATLLELAYELEEAAPWPRIQD